MKRFMLIAAGMLIGLSGCATDPTQGYSFASTYRSDVKTIAVPVWTNTTYQQGLEARLAEAIVNEVRKSTPYAITEPATAQTVLSGTINSAELRTLSIGRDSGLVEELAFELVVDFEWKDTRTGKNLVARRQFSTARSFVPARGVGERIDVGQNATIQQLARDIVAEMRSGW